MMLTVDRSLELGSLEAFEMAFTKAKSNKREEEREGVLGNEIN